VNISPDEVHALPVETRHDFLLAFVDALQPVFLVGAALTLVAFALSWFLREVPLRGTTAAADLERGAEAVVAGADARVSPDVSPGRRTRSS
jgi:hypothetical protein